MGRRDCSRRGAVHSFQEEGRGGLRMVSLEVKRSKTKKHIFSAKWAKGHHLLGWMGHQGGQWESIGKVTLGTGIV